MLMIHDNTYRTGCCDGNVQDLYRGGSRCEFRPGYPLSRLSFYASFLSPSRYADFRERRYGGTEWTDLAQKGDQWRTAFNTALNFRVA